VEVDLRDKRGGIGKRTGVCLMCAVVVVVVVVVFYFRDVHSHCIGLVF
jgi:hypothetical protein